MIESWFRIPCAASRSIHWRTHSCPRRLYSAKVSKPLRILYCGSDEFSCESLRAVNAEKERNPELIASIDVLARNGKRAGRGMKEERHVPIKAVAQEFKLPIHEITSFTNWQLPKPGNESINLIIAVSFGLFVPPRILKGAEYGGLNIHPSLLPNFRGAAPLQHALLSGEKTTGITLQTLDHHSFDHGTILSQTEPPGIRIPPGCTYESLLKIVKPKAAEMLVDGLRNRLFVHPLVDVGKYESNNLKKAHKITSEDRRVEGWWHDEYPSNVLRQSNALGRLWCEVRNGENKKARVIFEDIGEVTKEDFANLNLEKIHGFKAIAKGSPETDVLWMCDQKGELAFIGVPPHFMRVSKITVEGQPTKPAAAALRPFSRAAASGGASEPLSVRILDMLKI